MHLMTDCALPMIEAATRFQRRQMLIGVTGDGGVGKSVVFRR
jgi:putative protein kinase ArgK-like GTPase of G3E family